MKTDEQILKIVIDKAKQNGWKHEMGDFIEIDVYVTGNSIRFVSKKYTDGKVMTCWFESISNIIFSHDFAKALWGEEPRDTYGTTYDIKEWQHHLQQMVLEEDPIKYLERFI